MPQGLELVTFFLVVQTDDIVLAGTGSSASGVLSQFLVGGGGGGYTGDKLMLLKCGTIWHSQASCAVFIHCRNCWFSCSCSLAFEEMGLNHEGCTRFLYIIRVYFSNCFEQLYPLYSFFHFKTVESLLTVIPQYYFIIFLHILVPCLLLLCGAIRFTWYLVVQSLHGYMVPRYLHGMWCYEICMGRFELIILCSGMLWLFCTLSHSQSGILFLHILLQSVLYSYSAYHFTVDLIFFFFFQIHS